MSDRGQHVDGIKFALSVLRRIKRLPPSVTPTMFQNAKVSLADAGRYFDAEERAFREFFGGLDNRSGGFD